MKTGYWSYIGCHGYELYQSDSYLFRQEIALSFELRELLKRVHVVGYWLYYFQNDKDNENIKYR